MQFLINHLSRWRMIIRPFRKRSTQKWIAPTGSCARQDL